MLLTRGELILIVTRRSFEKDRRRHFIGTVEDAEGTAIRLTGYEFYVDNTNQYRKIPEMRTWIFPLADSHMSVNVLPHEIPPEGDNIVPREIAPDDIEYSYIGGKLCLTVEGRVIYDMAEYQVS